MIEFSQFPASMVSGADASITIAVGPVIIENDKVLLDKHGEDNFWKFPGGRLRDDSSLPENAKREAKEELGIEVELIGEPFTVVLQKESGGVNNFVVLVHYLAKRLTETITPGADILQWDWVDINNLPDDCAANIKLAVKHFQTYG